MKYCLDCQTWHGGPNLHEQCPACLGDRLIDPIAERREWMDRVDKLSKEKEILLAKVGELNGYDIDYNTNWLNAHPSPEFMTKLLGEIDTMTDTLDDVLESLKTILPTSMFPVRKFIQILINRIEKG